MLTRHLQHNILYEIMKGINRHRSIWTI